LTSAIVAASAATAETAPNVTPAAMARTMSFSDDAREAMFNE
jgi:hypothetical protein